MKLLLVILAFLFLGSVLGLGILLAVKGQPWLLIVALLSYLLAFVRLGCLPKQSH